MLLRPGDILEGQLDTYHIIATISRGAYGCAFRALALDGSWRVVKQFEPSEELSPDDHLYQRKCFEREADILIRFRSPQMVRGYELIRGDDEAFFVMEHVQGQTLRQVFDRHLHERKRPFDAATVVAIGRQLCAVLDELHHLPGQLIYRDLKPANIMWDAVGRRLRLIDFGAARFNADGQQATQGLGTEGYAPPELYGSGASLTPATDVYTLGAVLYELSCGEPPGREASPDFRGWAEQLPLGLREAILRALQPAPEQRFASANAFGAALAATMPTEPGPPLMLAPRNQHPLMACYCPACGMGPEREQAVYCGRDGAMYQVAMLQIVPRYRPAQTLYLDRREATLGRSDPDRGYFPEIDLTAADPARHVSRRHATLVRDGLEYRVTVHPTTNPTRIDGVLAEPLSTHPLAPGARLELGDLVAVLLVKPVLDAPADTGETV